MWYIKYDNVYHTILFYHISIFNKIYLQIIDFKISLNQIKLITAYHFSDMICLLNFAYLTLFKSCFIFYFTNLYIFIIYISILVFINCHQ